MKRTIKNLINRFLILLIIAIAYTLTIVPNHASETKRNQTESNDVLIIYSTGTPVDSPGDLSSEEYDSITLPTPKRENVKTVTEKLGISLRKKNFVVRVVEASEIRHQDELFNARLIIIGSPSYLGNVSWKIKKFMDEFFYRIYSSGKKRLGGKCIAAFSMAEIEPSAQKTLDAIRTAVGDYRGTFGPTMIVLTKQTEQEIKEHITRFTEQVALEIK